MLHQNKVQRVQHHLKLRSKKYKSMHPMLFQFTTWMSHTVQEFRKVKKKKDRGDDFKEKLSNSSLSKQHKQQYATLFEILHDHADLVCSCSLNCRHSSLHQCTHSSKSPKTHAHVPHRIQMKVHTYSRAWTQTTVWKVPLHFLHIILLSSCITKHRQLRMSSKLQVHSLQSTANPATLRKALLVASWLTV